MKTIFKIIRFILSIVPFVVGSILTLIGVGFLSLGLNLFVLISAPFMFSGLGLIDFAHNIKG